MLLPNPREREKSDFIKSRTFCTSKVTIKKVEKQPTKEERIFANHIPSEAPCLNYIKIVKILQ